MYNTILSILLCFFAIFGIIDITKYLLNRIYEKRLYGKYTILIDNTYENTDIEYLIRYMESTVIGRHDKLISGITISSEVMISNELYQKLQNEFDNLKKI